jgi:penicillin amidase
MTGQFPKRKYDVVHGIFPKKGWMKENQWEGFLFPKDMPRLLNPASGIIASANNMITTKNFNHGVSHSFSFTTRSRRIK